MVIPRLLVLSLGLSLAGCEAVDHFRLTNAVERYRNMCTQSATVDCATQLVDINILTLGQIRRTADHEQKELVHLSGNRGYDSVISAIDKEIAHQQELKPNLIADWFMPQSPDKSMNAPVSVDFYAKLKARAVDDYEQSMTDYGLASINAARWQALNMNFGSSIWPQ
ncbi:MULTISPECIES: hypothetical protein [unclassified Pseudomonas]|uniref:hypothetical protein n=1 Tax=unclassified Pseudomonas TaxID=196821 RepID=UPI0039B787B5